MICSMIKKVAV